MKYKPRKFECGVDGCTIPRRAGQRMCPLHHAEYMRKWREDRGFVKVPKSWKKVRVKQ